MYGFDYQWLGVKATPAGQALVLVRCEKAEANCKEQTLANIDLTQTRLSLRMSVSAEAKTQFAYSLDTKTFTPIGDQFSASKGRWVGAQMGLFSLGKSSTSFVDVDYFRVAAN
jgi:Beta xylosidase C-terminal Concanavalin A-like domain